MASFTPYAVNGVLHRYHHKLSAFEHAPASSSSSLESISPADQPLNYLLFVAGLGDNFLTVTYPTLLAQHLPSTWRLVEVSLASSYRGWGTSSLSRDVKELGAAVSYFRGLQEKQGNSGSREVAAGDESTEARKKTKKKKNGLIVIMGHSTGTQDALSYLISSTSNTTKLSPVDGAILQAPVSDREATLASSPSEVTSALTLCAQRYVQEKRASDVLPNEVVYPVYGNVPVTAYRALSLLSPGHDGDDDMFSSDLGDARLRDTFGAVGKSGAVLMILYSGADEHVPEGVDKKALVERWEGFVNEGGGKVDANGGVVEHATHNLNDDGDGVRKDLVDRVLRYLDGLIADESGVPHL